MSRWVISSSLALLALPAVLVAQTITQEEALQLAFPAPHQVERKTAYLDEAQVAQARKLAGSGIEIRQSVVTYYLATLNGAPAGVAYFDAHRVRTLPEVVMFVVAPDGRIRRSEVLRFSEPPEYRAPEKWRKQLEGKSLEPDLSLKRGIVNLTGATLTAKALTDAARRVLALHAVIQPFGAVR